MDMNNLSPISTTDLKRDSAKTLYRSICVPSAVQSYSLCIEFIKNWFLSKFDKDTFKTIYVDGKNIFDDFRKLSKIEFVKKQKPALAIIPSISWDFTNDNIDSYPYGLDVYCPLGRFKDSFFSCPETESYLGIGLETMLVPFSFRIRLETRAQQIDMYKYIKMACRVGFTCGDYVNLDFHIPYQIIIQLAKDNHFETYMKNDIECVKDVSKFLRWLNMHSEIPFIYKYRALNGRNEFFLRMRDAYVHIRPGDLSADDGERESQMTNNFGIDFNVEVRFPAPKMYAYYSNNEHKLTEVYGAWYQPNNPITGCYTFKGSAVPDNNSYGWPLYMNTTYEVDKEDLGTRISIDITELMEGDIKDCIDDCMAKGISPAIFCDFKFYNGGEYLAGSFDWSKMTFHSDTIIRSLGTFIAVYIDNDYLSDFMLSKNGEYENRIQKSK